MADELGPVQVAERLAEVRARIAAAALKAGRHADDVTLVAVSKTKTIDDIRPVLSAGQRHFGENRVQEAEAKWPTLRREYPDIVLHLIGPLQTNKVRDAVALFEVIETVDRDRLAAKMALEVDRQGRCPQIYVEVNTGEEVQKAGFPPNEVADFVERLSRDFGLKAEGLMCIPPLDEEPALHFALLEKLARQIGVAGLSMGMSHDFETAIAFGATEVRVGTAIFGERSAPLP